jgi:tetraacyldisaccharide 4'-kinase
LISIKNEAQEIWSEIQPDGRTAFSRAILQILSIPYSAAVAFRNRLYDRGVLKPVKLPCPVISVGNITVGGTGKSPTVILIASLLKEKGFHPAVLSRGYGGDTNLPVNIVSDGKCVSLGCREAGDEPVMIAQALPGIPVLTGPKRSLTGREAAERFGADVLILDDGFQHRSIFRDIDIVLLDAGRPFGNGFLLPRGPLRESPQALARATGVLRTGDSASETSLGKFDSSPSFRGVHKPREIVAAATGNASPLAMLKGMRVFAFAGIGAPDSFRKSLEALGAEVAAFRIFADHHPYSRSDIGALRLMAKDSGATMIVTTQKDAVRLTDFPDFLREVSLLRIGMEISPGGQFAEWICSRLAAARSTDGC